MIGSNVNPLPSRPFMRRSAILLLTLMVSSLSSVAPAQQAPASAPAACTVDLELVGTMRDILSNALMHGMGREESEVRDVLAACRKQAQDGPDMLRRTALAVGVEEAVLRAEVERFRHVNCSHGPDAAPEAVASPDDPGAPVTTAPEGADGADGAKLTTFAENVTVHVVLHELAHALVREFDLPVLANEEALADAFATHYLVTRLPERALDVLKARVDSLMFEAREVARHEWTVKGEHNSDARRAYQIAALALAADAEAYAPLAHAVGMIGSEIKVAADYGAEIHRSWRRLLGPLWMPDGQASTEARVRFDDEGMPVQIESSGIVPELRAALRAFDWHSQVTLRFVQGDGGAGWSRSRRTITVHSAYVERFVRQGRALAAATDR